MRIARIARWSLYGVVALLLGVVVYYSCFLLYKSWVKPYAAVFAASRSAPSKRIAGGERSGFRLLIDNDDALMSRVVLADRAERTIDLQYYIFDADATGRLIAEHLLAAADRGVRVRVLVDDLDAGDAFAMLRRLDAHPNVEVRLFNPFRTRDPSLVSKVVQFMIDGRRLNRRMHNKSYIVDDDVAIIGGRNLGDAYFEDDPASEPHFRDLDVIAIGGVVPQTTRAFDKYWTSAAAEPVRTPASAALTPADMAQLRGRLARTARALAHSDYAAGLPDALPGGSTAERPGQWSWGRAAVVSDEPEKVEDVADGVTAQSPWPRLDSMIGAARNEVLLVAAYFVPGDRYSAYLAARAQRGVKVKVLTNSLAATDEPMVNAGYAHYRRELLAGGVELYELKPSLANQDPEHGKSAGVSLHAKAAVIDRHLVFIGSMNLDLRSKLLNTEMGVIADCPELAAATRDFFEHATSARSAYHVMLDEHGNMVWRATGTSGAPVVYTHEPDVSIWRRGEVDLLRLLPLDELL
jgi:putative cardiolipin synthase